MTVFDVDYCVRRPLVRRQPNTECSSPYPPLRLSVFELRRSKGRNGKFPQWKCHRCCLPRSRRSSPSQQSQSGKLHAMHAAFLFKQNLKKQASFASEATFTNFSTAAALPRWPARARSHPPWDPRCENFTNFAAAGHLGFRECFRRNGKTAMRNVMGFLRERGNRKSRLRSTTLFPREYFIRPYSDVVPLLLLYVPGVRPPVCVRPRPPTDCRNGKLHCS